MRRVKLFLLGPGGAGKSTLAAHLVSGKFQHDIEWTDGVSVREWNPVCDDYKPIRVSIWDCGGQDTYLVTHPFFFRRRLAMYAVVCKPSDGGAPGSSVREYVGAIHSRAPGAPIVFISTHADVAAASAGHESALQSLVPGGARHFAVSSRTGAGMGALTEFLIGQARTLPHAAQRYPRAVRELESRLTSLLPSESPYGGVLTVKAVLTVARSECGAQDDAEVHCIGNLCYSCAFILHLMFYTCKFQNIS